MRKALALAALLATTSAPAMAATNFQPNIPGTVVLENHSYYQITSRIIDVFWDATLQCTGNDTQLLVPLPKAPKPWYSTNAYDLDHPNLSGPNGPIARDFAESRVQSEDTDNELVRGSDTRFQDGKIVLLLGQNNPCIPGRTFSFTAHVQYVF